MAITEYFYVGEVPPTVSKGKVDSLVEPQATEKKINQKFNPIFNFDQSFINGLQSISNIELGQSVPYVSLRTVNIDGSVMTDLNLSYFFKAIDIDNINTSGRFSDRPAMSLQELEIRTDLASGYLYYTNVTLKIRIHAPEMLETNTDLLAMLIPGMPLLLEYGWNSPNEFLNEAKEKFLFQVMTYNMNIDTTGQIDVTVQGMALNETFNNVYVGDTEFDNRIDNLTEQLEILKELKAKNTKNRKLIKLIAQDISRTEDAEDKARRKLRKLFNERIKELRTIDDKTSFSPKLKNESIIKLHDLVWTLCDETFSSMGALFPGVTEFNVVYGNFNNNVGKLSGKSIAEFPIHKRKFFKQLQVKKNNGQHVLTVGALLSLLCSEFIENSKYWTMLLSKKEQEAYKHPDIAINFFNKGDTLEVHFVDTGSKIPPSTSQMLDGPQTDDELEGLAVENDVPIIRTGHANSFIKTISLSQITDQHMKAALIERMNSKRMESKREALITSQSQKGIEEGEPTDITPLTLPFQGTASVIGHTSWKPFRAFYLAAGVYVLNAVYKITAVKHKLSSEGFDTSIDFIYH